MQAVLGNLDNSHHSATPCRPTNTPLPPRRAVGREFYELPPSGKLPEIPVEVLEAGPILPVLPKPADSAPASGAGAADAGAAAEAEAGAAAESMAPLPLPEQEQEQLPPLIKKRKSGTRKPKVAADAAGAPGRLPLQQQQPSATPQPGQQQQQPAKPRPRPKPKPQVTPLAAPLQLPVSELSSRGRRRRAVNYAAMEKGDAVAGGDEWEAVPAELLAPSSPPSAGSPPQPAQQHAPALGAPVVMGAHPGAARVHGHAPGMVVPGGELTLGQAVFGVLAAAAAAAAAGGEVGAGAVSGGGLGAGFGGAAAAGAGEPEDQLLDDEEWYDAPRQSQQPAAAGAWQQQAPAAVQRVQPSSGDGAGGLHDEPQAKRHKGSEQPAAPAPAAGVAAGGAGQQARAHAALPWQDAGAAGGMQASEHVGSTGGLHCSVAAPPLLVQPARAHMHPALHGGMCSSACITRAPPQPPCCPDQACTAALHAGVYSRPAAPSAGMSAAGISTTAAGAAQAAAAGAAAAGHAPQYAAGAGASSGGPLSSGSGGHAGRGVSPLEDEDSGLLPAMRPHHHSSSTLSINRMADTSAAQQRAGSAHAAGQQPQLLQHPQQAAWEAAQGADCFGQLPPDAQPGGGSKVREQAAGAVEGQGAQPQHA